MFNLQQFIADHVICRPTSMFAADIEANKETLQAEIRNKSVCVIGGAGSIGSSFIKAVLPFKPNSKELCLCLIAGRHDDREICGSHTVPQATGTVQTCGGTSPQIGRAHV